MVAASSFYSCLFRQAPTYLYQADLLISKFLSSSSSSSSSTNLPSSSSPWHGWFFATTFLPICLLFVKHCPCHCVFKTTFFSLHVLYRYSVSWVFEPRYPSVLCRLAKCVSVVIFVEVFSNLPQFLNHTLRCEYTYQYRYKNRLFTIHPVPSCHSHGYCRVLRIL